MQFDVASIRQSPPADSYTVTGSFAPHSSTFTSTNLDAMNLVLTAYGVQAHQVSGLPSWSTLFNVQAKSDSDTDKRLAALTAVQQRMEQQHMMQGLLADRFKLKVHWEKRDGSAYALIAVKSHRGLAGAGSLQLKPEEKQTFGGKPVPPIYQSGSSMTSFTFVAHACSMENLAGILAGQFGRPVLDKTGLTGTYDFTLRYKGIRDSERDPDDMDPVPTLEHAVQEQLGLKLEATKAPDDILVIDHIEMPSEN